MNKPRELVVGLFRALIALLVAGLLLGCRSSDNDPPQTVEQLHARLARAVQRGQQTRVYELLDLQSQWSVQTALKAQRKIRRLVREHYPPQRQARELGRTQLAAGVTEPQQYFARLAQQRKLLAPLSDLAAIDGREGKGQQLTLVSGKVRLRCCREAKRWAFCGLRQQLERHKIRVVHDLETVQEGIEIQGGG